jgi:hypothetical protein
MDPNSPPQRVVIHAAKRPMAPEQRAGLILVTVIGSLTAVLGLFFVLKHVSSPFLMTYEGPVFETTAQKQAKEIAAQKNRDTDGDGLNDYDELYIYKTSAYLSDTDGDGYNDASEIAAGTNPNCPAGADCETALSNANAAVKGSAAGGFVDELLQPVEMPTVSSASTTDVLSAFENLSIDQIRQMLIESGADPATVEALSDEQVKQLYDSALAQVKLQAP